MKKLISILFLLFLYSCNDPLFTIDKAHYHYQKDPKGYTACTYTQLTNFITYCGNSSTPPSSINFNPNLITDTAQFHWLCSNYCQISNSTPPIIDFNNNSLIVTHVQAQGNGSYIERHKVLIDNTNKIILVKCLVKAESGDYSWNINIEYLIPKVTPDYTVNTESWTTGF